LIFASGQGFETPSSIGRWTLDPNVDNVATQNRSTTQQNRSTTQKTTQKKSTTEIIISTDFDSSPTNVDFTDSNSSSDNFTKL
jgi:hypothetical protein